jgi:allantoate deiminase
MIRGGLSSGTTVMARLDALAEFTETPGRLTRLYLTPEHKAAALQVRVWMEEAGMSARMDAVGNIVGRYEGEQPNAPALLVGSHIDTVRDAGKYDGNLGVLAAIQAVAELHARRVRLPCAIEVLAFGDEEGVRFPVTLNGSRAIAGTFDPAALEARDGDGTTLREALEQFGCDPAGIPDAARRVDDVLGYVEVHIEQGPVLEDEDLPVGIVTAINGASRFGIEVTGVAGHAGTVPMHLRRDALAAAAEMVLAVEREAKDTPGIVATVGMMEALPGAVNVIASGAKLSLDLRSSSDDLRREAVARLKRQFDEIAERRGVGVQVTPRYDEPAATCALWLVDQMAAAVERAGIRPLRLPSGAGHDGLAMIALCPIAMLFVRCAGGISHNPAEAITAQDADAAIRVLTDFLRHLTPPQ